MDYDYLLDLAHDAIENSYSPYSGFRVAACVLSLGGNTYTGVNVENTSYSLTMCAERAAIASAIAAGDMDIVAVAVFHDGDEMPYPCGSCLQVMSEFNKDMAIIVSNNLGIEELSLSDLLPIPFSM